MWLKAPDISCTHGFSTRHGGVSEPPFHALNLGGSQDDPEKIRENRTRALDQLGLDPSALCYLKQVHGNQVCLARPGIQEGDALVTRQKELILAVSAADCYPVLFYDEPHGVIGAAHAGWRGTLSGIVGATIRAMLAEGARAENIKVAIGQGISQEKFEVGPDVIRQFHEAGFPDHCWRGNLLDLIACNRFVLAQHHIPDRNIWSMNRCTYEDDFFSYRRDQGLTGRMWGLISLQGR
jgi:YfiH family protein